MGNPTFSMDLDAVDAAAAAIGGLGDSALKNSWPGVGECLSPSVAASVADFREWFRFGWATIAQDVTNASSGALSAAHAVRVAEGHVAEAFGGYSTTKAV